MAKAGSTTVHAAGAIVWRGTGRTLEVLLVHRPRYDDWSWPKGKLDPGESLPACAVREVAEETGHSIVLGLPLPQGWRDRFPRGATAPSIGSWRNWGKAFLARAPRLAGADPSEALHPTVPRPYPGPALLTGALSSAAPERRHRRAPRVKNGADPHSPARPSAPEMQDQMISEAPVGQPQQDG